MDNRQGAAGQLMKDNTIVPEPLVHKDMLISESTRQELIHKLREARNNLRDVAHFAHDEYQQSLEQDLYVMVRQLEARIGQFIKDQAR
jgi:hypothetical protein